MPSDSGDRRPTKPHQLGVPPPEPEHLPCPRCDSTNTKFCYYNNYNFSQPRHFCKGCRRYWTHGGTLRDIPIGGGSRKNAKRARAASAASHDYLHVSDAATTTPILVPLAASHGGSVPLFGDAISKPGLTMCGGFTSLLSTQGPGFLGLGSFGLGIGPAYEEMGFGLGRTVWPVPGAGDAATSGGGPAGMMLTGGSWQLEGGEGGFVGGDQCFTLSDLAISAPGNAMK